MKEAESILAVVNTTEGWKTTSSADCHRIASNLEKRLVPHRAVAYVGGAISGIDEDPGEVLITMIPRPHST